MQSINGAPPYYNKNRLCSKTCGKEMNTERKQIMKKIEKLNRKEPKERKKLN